MKFSYKVISDIFNDIQDNEGRDAEQVLPRFGLIDSSPARWDNLRRRIAELNNTGAASSTTYRVLFVGRHGEGYHNFATNLYGREKWREYWSKRTNDGNITWGPDPLLTETGINQAYNINRLWKAELSFGIPIPESFYCSPLSRAITTALISFEGIALDPASNEVGKKPKAIVKENLKEGNLRLCSYNTRRSRTFIKETYPQFEIEEGFAEEDMMFVNGTTETGEQVKIRVRKALDEIFESDESTYISISAHIITNGVIRDVLGAPSKRMPTGGVFAMVISVTPIIQTSETMISRQSKIE